MNKIIEEFNQLKKMSNEKKVLLIVFFFILFIISLRLGKILSQSPKPTIVPTVSTPSEVKKTPLINQQITPTLGVPATKLALSPSNLNLKIGEEKTISLMLSELPVTVLTVNLKYDPTTLELSDLKNGDIFRRLIQNKIESGKLTYTSAVNLEEVTSLKEGVAFTFKIKALKEIDNTTIEIDNTETQAALDGANRLGSTTNATIEIVK